MNTNAELWTAALRGGAYRQTRRRLCQRSRMPWRRPTFCALGVLYDLHLKDCGEAWPAKPPVGQLPEAVLQWAGIPRDLEGEIIAQNDRGRSFAEIASIIEAHFHRAERDRRWNEASAVVQRYIERARGDASVGAGGGPQACPQVCLGAHDLE